MTATAAGARAGSGAANLAVTIWKVESDSSHFTFEAYGRTEEEAIVAFHRLIDIHVQQFDADPTWAMLIKADLVATQITTGVGYRDGDAV